MFTNIRVQDIGGTAIRHSIPTGAVFKYHEGNGTSYLSFGVYTKFLLAAKLASVNNIANFTITPLDSGVTNRTCEIIGVFDFALDMYAMPEIGVADREFTFGYVISLKGDVDDDGNSHLYLTVGNEPDADVKQQLLLRLTGQDTAHIFRAIPDDSLIAVRGTAGLKVEYLERKA